MLKDPGHEAGRHLDGRDGAVHVADAEEPVVTDIEEDPTSAEIGVFLNGDEIHDHLLSKLSR